MKSLFQFSVPTTRSFLFNETIETNETTSSSKKETVLTSEKKDKLDQDQMQRLDNALINKALEAAEFQKSSFSVMGKEESMMSIGQESLLELPEGFESLPASAFLKRSSEELRTLFLDEKGTVNFHGNENARRRIGAGDLFPSSQQFIKINGTVGQRSIDSGFHSSKVGYIDKQGNYIQITGGEQITTDVTENETEGFEKSTIDQNFEYTRPDGAILHGELAYKAQFGEEVRREEEYEKLDWKEKVKRSDEITLNTKVDLSRLPGGNEQMARTVGRILAHKDQYLAIQEATGVPWMLIAAIHARESNNKFDTYLHNGELLGKRTKLHPEGILFEKGQWKEAAIDALTRVKNANSEFSSLNPNSSLGEMALFAERYNGRGYEFRGLPSPYVYSGTDRYERGKYVADHVFDAATVDTRLGVMPIILALRGLE